MFGVCKFKTYRNEILTSCYFLSNSKNTENVYSFDKHTRVSHQHMMQESLSTNDPEVRGNSQFVYIVQHFISSVDLFSTSLCFGRQAGILPIGLVCVHAETVPQSHIVSYNYDILKLFAINVSVTQ